MVILRVGTVLTLVPKVHRGLNVALREICLWANPGTRERDLIWKRVLADATELRIST